MNVLGTKGWKNTIPPQKHCFKEIGHFIYERLEVTYFPLGSLEKCDLGVRFYHVLASIQVYANS